jgi:hypothetical protein
MFFFEKKNQKTLPGRFARQRGFDTTRVRVTTLESKTRIRRPRAGWPKSLQPLSPSHFAKTAS